MFMKWLLSGLGLAVLFSAPLTYAADCTTLFDQSCLSSSYSGEQVEADHKRRQESLEAFQKAQEEQAIQDAKEEAKQAIEATKERQHQEQLKAQEDIRDAILIAPQLAPSPVVDVHIHP